MPPLETSLLALLGPNRLLCSPDALLAWECDGFTVHRSRPRAVVLPESTAEVQAVLRLLHAAKVPFVPRGAGTCLSGGPTASNDAVIVCAGGVLPTAMLQSIGVRVETKRGTL